MPPDFFTISCLVESALLLATIVATVISRRSSAIRRSLHEAAETTRQTRPQWLAILSGIIGANAGYIFLIGSFLLLASPQDPPDNAGFFVISAAVAYLFCGLPTYLTLGAIVGLLVSRYADRNSLPDSATIAISLAGSAATGGLLSIPIYFIGLMGAAL
jgi:hypothetical protein